MNLKKNVFMHLNRGLEYMKFTLSTTNVLVWSRILEIWIFTSTLIVMQNVIILLSFSLSCCRFKV